MSSRYQSRWIRIAGISKRIKAGTPPPHWRCEIEGEPEQILLTGWTFLGEALKGNNTQGTNPKAEGIEFIAWVACYGDVVIDDDRHATITLLPVSE